MNTYDVTILCVNNNMSIYQDIFETKSSQHILKNKYEVNLMKAMIQFQVNSGKALKLKFKSNGQ